MDIQPAQSPETAHLLQNMQAVNEQLVLASLREQVLAEQLRRQLAFTNAITTSLGEGVYVIDSAGQCTFVNPAAERMLGWNDADLHGKSIDVILPTHATPEPSSITLYGVLMGVLQTGTTHRDDNAMFLHRDGGMFPTAYVAAPISMEGQVSGAVITFRDMTDVRRLQHMREEYVSLISHDLRAPLTVIKGRAELLVRRLTQHGLIEEANSAKSVVASSRRMNQMIEELLERSRTDTRPDTVQRTAIDLVSLVQQMIEQTVAPADRARVTLDAIATLLVVVDVVQIERVVVNVLTNALKFSASDAPIGIRVARHETYATVSVMDVGVGIAPADLPLLFEKHYRASSVGAIAGNGLGLYSSRLIMEAHEGRLLVESVLGGGSTFTMTLPLEEV